MSESSLCERSRNERSCATRSLFSNATRLAIAKSRATSAASERSARSSSGMPQCRPGPKPPKPGPNGPRGPQPKPKPGPKGPRGPRQPQPRGPPKRNAPPGPNGPRGPSPSRDIQGGVQPSQLACPGSGESPDRLLKSPNIFFISFSIERTFAIYRIYQLEQCDISLYSHLRYIGLKVANLKMMCTGLLDMLSPFLYNFSI